MTEIRPWGSYEILHTNGNHQVKTLTVEPGHRLSYQTHEHRSEYWVIVSGSGIVTFNGQEALCQVGDAFVIEQGDAHRIANVYSEPLVFIEVQLGDQLREDDIVRLEDDYGRTEL